MRAAAPGPRRRGPRPGTSGRALLALGLLSLSACNTGFAPQYLVKDLRVLAARAEVEGDPTLAAADGDAGDTLRLTALVANPQGLEVTVRWLACLPQAGTAVSACLDPDLLRDPARLDGRPGIVELGAGEAISVPVPAELQPALDALIDRARARPEYACTLYAELPVLAIASASGATSRSAVKVVRITPWREVLGTKLQDVYVRNRNPSLVSVRADPADEDACGGGTAVGRSCTTSAGCGGVACVEGPAGSPADPGQCADAAPAAGLRTLCALPAEGSIQVYRQCNADGTRTDYLEDLGYQWYATAGELKRKEGSTVGESGNVTGQAVTFDAPPGGYTLWVIVRDGRGGVGWIRRDVP